MTDDEPRTEPTDDQPVIDAAKPPEDTGAPKAAVEPVEVDKTDMSAVGDDGQVFGG